MQNQAHLPDLAIFLNPSENLGAIRECTAKNIPTIGIVDSDTDPRIVTYPIPANMEVSCIVHIEVSEHQLTQPRASAQLSSFFRH